MSSLSVGSESSVVGDTDVDSVPAVEAVAAVPVLPAVPAPINPFRQSLNEIILWHKHQLNGSLARLLTHMSEHGYTGSISATLSPLVFKAIFNQTRYIAPNGNYLVFIKLSDGTWSTKPEKGYFPPSLLWWILNNGVEMIGRSKKHTMMHQVQNVNVVFSASTKVTTVFLECKKKDISSNAWVPMVAKRIQMH